MSCDEIPDSDIIFAFKTAKIDRVLNQKAAYFEQKKMDLLLQWRYGVAPAMVCHKALALEASLRREKIWASITAGPNPQAQGPSSC